jgi:hypothetical protein
MMIRQSREHVTWAGAGVLPERRAYNLMPKRACALVEKTVLKQQCNTDYVLEENQV